MSFPKKILMVDPKYFDVTYAINVHMQDENGNLNKVDKQKAQQQWHQLKVVYAELGLAVEVIQPVENLVDMVFCANTFFALDKKTVVLSRMFHEPRKEEVTYMKKYFHDRDIKTYDLPEGLSFEGMGDCLWDYEGHRLFAGHGFRTDQKVYDFLETLTDTPITRLKLIDRRFYHLDTCLSIFNKDSAAYVPCAFAPTDISLLKQAFQNLIEIDEAEAINHFAANSHCPDGKHVLVHPGADKFNHAVREKGLEIIEVDTSEYMKSGGSVFCMKHSVPFE